MRTTFELQLLRNWDPRSRITVGELHHSYLSRDKTDSVLLMPAIPQDSGREMLVEMRRPQSTYAGWLTFDIRLRIDGICLSSWQPTELYIGNMPLKDQRPISVVHFPVVAAHTHPVFGGRHSLLFWPLSHG